MELKITARREDGGLKVRACDLALPKVQGGRGGKTVDYAF